MAEPSGGNKISTRAAGIVGLAVMCSRILGLVREQIFAALFEKRLLDIFIVAFRTPNLFLEGAEWLLSVDPEAGTQIAPGSVVWALPMASVNDRSVTLYYTFDAERVIFLGIESFD